jgi:hypothetical protein
VVDNILYSGLRTLSRHALGRHRPGQRRSNPAPTSDPDVPRRRLRQPRRGVRRPGSRQPDLRRPEVRTASTCSRARPTCSTGVNFRQANFGVRASRKTGLNRTLNIGGDGINPNTEFSGDTATPRSVSQRYPDRPELPLSPDSVNLFAEAKYVTEDTDLITQPVFGDIHHHVTSTEDHHARRPGQPADLTARSLRIETQPIFNNQTFVDPSGQRLSAGGAEDADPEQHLHHLQQPDRERLRVSPPRKPASFRPIARHRFFGRTTASSSTAVKSRVTWSAATATFGDIGFVQAICPGICRIPTARWRTRTARKVSTSSASVSLKTPSSIPPVSSAPPAPSSAVRVCWQAQGRVGHRLPSVCPEPEHARVRQGPAHHRSRPPSISASR